MAAYIAIQTGKFRAGASAAEAVDHQRQRDLIEPGPQLLTRKRLAGLALDLPRPIQKAAAELDLPLGTVKSRIRLAFDKLRGVLSRE